MFFHIKLYKIPMGGNTVYQLAKTLNEKTCQIKKLFFPAIFKYFKIQLGAFTITLWCKVYTVIGSNQNRMVYSPLISLCKLKKI